MADSFELLQEPRRPWLDPEELKVHFHSLSASWHPDRFHNAPASERAEATERYANLNAAYQQLKEPKDRLLHLYELEAGQKPKDIQRIPPGTMDLFVEVGESCRAVDQFIQERSQVTSPLLKVQWFSRAHDWIDKLNALQQRVNEMRIRLEKEMQGLNALWESAGSDPAQRRVILPLEHLEQIYRSFSYVSRWTEQIQERVVQLMAGDV